MGNLAGFDARTIEPSQGYDLIPPGDYDAVIIASEMKPTKDGKGVLLALDFKILGGQYQNRQIRSNLNMQNENSTTVEIAQGQLSAICRAVGVLTPTDSSELHMKPLQITIKTVKRKDNGELANEIKGYKPRSAQPVASPQVLATADVVAQYNAAPAKLEPWKK
jgi:hypothetical protein